MKEFIEKLIEMLEDEKAKEMIFGFKNIDNPFKKGCIDNRVFAYDKAIKIVNQLAEEHSANTPQKSADGWIPCSERLPNCEKDFLVTLRDGDVKVARYEKEENIWVDIIEGYFEYPVAAWCELPEPYKKGSETDE